MFQSKYLKLITRYQIYEYVHKFDEKMFLINDYHTLNRISTI